MNLQTEQRADVVIVTAIPLEYEAVLKVDHGAVPGSRWRETKQTNGVAMAYRPFTTPNGRPLLVAVAVAPDMATPALLSTLIPLVEQLEPRCIAMCGVCAGRRKKVKLGDVVAGERVYYYGTGKQTKKEDEPELIEQDIRTFDIRPDWKVALERMNAAEIFRGATWLEESRPLPTEWRTKRALWAMDRGASEPWQEVDDTFEEGDWNELVEFLREQGWVKGTELTDAGRKEAALQRFNHPGSPDLSPHGNLLPFKLHTAPMGSGERVIEDESIWAFISRSMRKTLAIEMEAAAVGAVAHYQHQRQLSFLVMKGVMDFADSGRDDQFKKFAARASAECLLWFLRHNLETPTNTGFDDVLSAGSRQFSTGNVAPSKLLQARYGVVQWHDAGRSKLLTKLDNWADSDKNSAVWLLHAEGGAGKTRLAIEWVRRRRDRFDVAGFLEPDLQGPWLEKLTTLQRPVIIVVDYAEIRPDLAAILRSVAVIQKSKKDTCKVRLLLLARSDGDWWTGLLKQNPDLELLLTEEEPHRLASFSSTLEDRQALWEAAANSFASYRGVSLSAVKPMPLTDDLYSRVLYVHISALLAIERVGPTRIDGIAIAEHIEVSAVSLLSELLDHEERYWVSRSSNRGNEASLCSLARQVIVAATLRGGFETLLECGDVFSCIMKRQRSAEDDRLLQLLSEIYQRDQLDIFLPGLEPDLLGEGMVLRLVSFPSRSGVDADWIERAVASDCNEHSITMAFTVLGRVSASRSETVRPWILRLLQKDIAKRASMALRAAKAVGEKTAFSALGDTLADVLNQQSFIPLEVLTAFENEGIPRPTVSMKRLAEWHSRTFLGLSLIAVTVKPDGLRANSIHARRLHFHAHDLRELGRLEPALDVMQQAVSRFRSLEKQHAPLFGPELARALNELSLCLAGLGQREKAVEAAQDACIVFESLSAADPSFRKEHAVCLSNVAVRTRILDQHQTSLAAIQKSVGIWRDLREEAGDDVRGSLASALNNLSSTLSALRNQNQALDALQESISLYQSLAVERPDTFQPDLAGGLHNLSYMQRLLGEHSEALKNAESSVQIFRLLFDRSSDAFRTGLAMSLGNLAICLHRNDRGSEGNVAFGEAVQLYRFLTSTSRSESDYGLAQVLFDFGNFQMATGNDSEAQLCLEEAAKLYRGLVDTSTTQASSLLAQSLVQSSILYISTGQGESALRLLLEARRLFEQCNSSTADAFHLDVAITTVNIAAAHSCLGHAVEAVDSAQEAVTLYRSCADPASDQNRLALASALNSLAKFLIDAEQENEAVIAGKEAFEVCLSLVAHSPSDCRIEVGLLFQNISKMMSNLNERVDAVAAARAAVAFFCAKAARSDDAQVAVASSNELLSDMYRRCGDFEAAATAMDHAVVIYKALAEIDSDEFLPAVARCLVSMGNIHIDIEHYPAAEHVARGVVEIYSKMSTDGVLYQKELEDAWSTLSIVLCARGGLSEGISASSEAVRLCRTRNDGTIAPMIALARTLGNHSSFLELAGDRLKAIESLDEAVSLYRSLCSIPMMLSDVDIAQERLAVSLESLGRFHSESKEANTARAHLQESADTYRALSVRHPRFLAESVRLLEEISATQEEGVSTP